ncbi:alpha/beta fold hydrolase [Streptomyces sp. NRRL S-118]|uniref:S15 peptidase family protein n=1 Tax=Streptomyces sp. NRRL S-118 TaxID=1463881 RepID=UPI00131C0A8D|nr:alpha/beta fold hydrolase [Streptomyces sp. NRRL S-118]
MSRGVPGAGRLGAVVAAAVLAGLPGAAPVAAAPGSPAGPVAGGATQSGAPHARDVVVRKATVRGADGTRLAARVYEPAGPGPYPLVVVPGPWISLPLDHVTRTGHYRALAAAGYVVVAYDPRGFRGSGGSADLGGPADTADLSRAVGWALEHTAADARRIGALGASYGAVIALNGAARDERIRAVVSLSGWARLSDGFRVNETRVAGVLRFQELLGRVDGRYGPDVERAFDRAASGELDESTPWVRERSPLTHVERLNRNGTAVLMVGEWDDPLVPAGRTGAFLDRLTGPRQLRMYRGGHTDSHTAATGAVARPPVWERAADWLDRHVRDPGGRAPGQRCAPTVVLQPRTGGPMEEYAGWSALQEAARPVPLEPGAGGGALVGGLASAAESGPFPVAGPLDSVGVPAVTAWPLLAPPFAVASLGAPLPRAAALRGHAQVEGVLVPGSADGTVVGHLYDVGPAGTARLLAHAPYTFRGRTPGTAHRFTLLLPATAWDVPAGHRLGVVFDTVDHRYAGEHPVGAPIEVVPSSLRLTAPLADAGQR